MKKSDLIQRVSERYPYLYHRDAKRVVDRIFEELAAALAEGRRVELRGFGSFSVRRREARLGRNPRTGEQVHVAEKFLPFFKTGKGLRDSLNPKEGED